MNIDEKSDHIREVYAHFGLAVYLAQVLEHGLVNAMVYLDLFPSNGRKVRTPAEWAERVDSFMDGHFENTLGRMVKNLRTVTQVPDDLENLLSQSLKKRNWLVHEYFRVKAADFMSASGRDLMIAELEQAQGLFAAADRRLEAVVKPIREKYGHTDELLALELERMKEEAIRDG